MHTIYLYMRMHMGDSLEGSKVCCSVLQPGQIDMAGWISLGYFCLFKSELAAGRRGWNTVRSAEWSSEGKEDFLEETFWKVRALTELRLL